MAKKPIQQQAVVRQCDGCGKLLPLNERGMPVTSLYFNGKWLCPDCKYDRATRDKFK